MRRLLTCLLGVCCLMAAAPARASDGGPALTVPTDDLDAALRCPDTFTSSSDPALLVHGTFTNDDENWSWNYTRGLRLTGYDVCTVTLPNRSLNDIQLQAEYVVNGVRKIAAHTGKPVDLIGHSQGGLQPRWAVKWWPDVQESVDDLITLATPNHGTALADGFGLSAGYDYSCFESCHQMRPGSAFLGALNGGGETPGAISYTSVYSYTDELVQPSYPTATAGLDGAANILMQDVCPGRPVSHVGFAFDAAVFRVVTDALAHDGPADVSRVDLNACLGTIFDGVDPVTLVLLGPQELQDGEMPDWEFTDREPPLRDYAR